LDKISRQGGALLVGIACLLIASSQAASAQTSALPPGWADSDIGNPLVAGSAQSTSGTMTVRGAGADIGGSSDQFHFAYQAVSGDTDIRVRLADLQAVDPGAEAGLMIRESLDADARHAFMLVSGAQGLAFQWRSRTGRRSGEVSGAVVTAPTWVRLVRQGDVFSAYSSPTGAAWTLVGSATVSMNTNAYVGLAVTSHDPNQTATGSFASLSFGGAPSPPSSSLPAPWTAGDIGSPTLPGSAAASAGIFTVTGGGPDIWGTSDQFQFVSQPVTGDTQIVARVGSLQGTEGWAKAGVMIRGALTGPSANASVFASRSNGWGFTRRLSAGGSSYYTPGGAGAAPGWVRLEREGNLFSAYQSQDGSQWTLIGSDTIPMPATIYVGLAITSATTAATATATLSNVAISTPTATNKPPTVSIAGPAPGASYAAPANISISATAGDVDGSVARVDFYAGTKLIASDTASPFSITWSNVPAGTYSLTAVATDNEAATATSQPVSVTVGAAPTQQLPTKVVFVPPVDYATNVTSCTVELRRSVDAVTASPVATRSLGKPAVVSGEISVDISTLVDPLPTGSYYAVVVAAGPGGSTPSGKSAVFSK
jgi:regulation of enolase protein 1 (concanavalin A-like superfamily)